MTLADHLDTLHADGQPRSRHDAHRYYIAKTGSRMAFDTFSRRHREWRRARPWIVEVEVEGAQWLKYQHEGVGEPQQELFDVA